MRSFVVQGRLETVILNTALSPEGKRVNPIFGAKNMNVKKTPMRGKKILKRLDDALFTNVCKKCSYQSLIRSKYC
jgi:hypothetical protein